jgi:hydroxypyruvate isomerase
MTLQSFPLAANLSLMFTEFPLGERWEQAARAGFRWVEIQFPYAQPVATIRRELERHGLRLWMHNLPAGAWEAGERGIACLPGREAEFAQGVEQALAYALSLEVGRLNVLAGIVPTDSCREEARRVLVGNLRYAAKRLADHGLTLMVEPLNRWDVPGFLLDSCEAAVAVIEEVGAPNLKLQLDLYHQQRTSGELIRTLERYWSLLGHLQIADNPGRHEPGTGEINYAVVFQVLQRLGWTQPVGCEYVPRYGTWQGLEALRPLGLGLPTMV